MSQDIKLYISITSFKEREGKLLKCLVGLKKQSLTPDKIYIYLSEDNAILGNGFTNKKLSPGLKSYIDSNKNIEIIWGKDIGPYGKLLPVLKKKWNEDCLIVTLDDDTIYDYNLFKNLVKDYNLHKCVISYRGIKMDIQNIKELKYPKIGKLTTGKSIFNFATGKGGVLYHPSFFHKTKDLIFREDIFTNICKTADDIWFMLVRYFNGIECLLGDEKWLLTDLTDNDAKSNLFYLNNIEGNNNLQIKKVLEKFQELELL